MINLVNISSGRILLACLILVIFVVFCSSCSSEPHITFSDYPNKGPISNDGYNAVLATTDLKTGDNRFSFLLTSPEGFVSEEDVVLRIYQGGSKAMPVEYVPDFIRWDSLTRGTYVGHVNFPDSGMWEASIDFNDSGARRSVKLFFDVSPTSQSPLVGEPVPLSESKTINSVDRIEDLSTGSLIYVNLYEMSIRDAIYESKPLITTFSSPAFCISEVCGPQVEVLNELSISLVGKINTIHVDVYADPPEAQLDIDSANHSEIFLQWGLNSPQWTFLTDCEGKVFRKYQGFAAKSEIESDVAVMFSKDTYSTGCTS